MTQAPPRIPLRTPLPTASTCLATARNWVGEGSYARVYRGVWGPGGTECALKAAKGEVSGAGQRLAAERELLTAVVHARLVRLYDYGEHAGAPFLVLEWLEGETLADILARDRRLPLRRALEVLEGWLEVLAAFESAGKHHGDVRAENGMVLPARGLVVVDPGAASPEGDGAHSCARDIQALGAIFHRMLTGEKPEREGLLRQGAGFSAPVLALWEATRGFAPPPARQLAEQVRRVRAAL